MRTTADLAAAFVILSTVSACRSHDSRGTGPSPISPSSPPHVGQVTLRSITPASGATLPVRDCTWEPETSSGNTQLCSAQSRINVDLEFESETTASVVAYFYRGSQVCARSERLFRGARGTAELNIISLTDTQLPDEVLTTAVHRCSLPIETTRIVLKVVERSDSPLMQPLQITQEFAHTFTFDGP